MQSREPQVAQASQVVAYFLEPHNGYKIIYQIHFSDIHVTPYSMVCFKCARMFWELCSLIFTSPER